MRHFLDEVVCGLMLALPFGVLIICGLFFY